MELRIFLAAGVVLVVFVLVTRSILRERRNEQYEDERTYFQDHYPDAWGLVEGAGDDQEDSANQGLSGRCPICDSENDPEFAYCRNCNSPLPERGE